MRCLTTSPQKANYNDHLIWREGREFFGTEDVIAIRDSVIALASAVLANPDYLYPGGTQHALLVETQQEVDECR